MDALYEYVNEDSVDPELICSICHSPLSYPRHTPCDEMFCRQCITNWIETQSASCPLCRGPLSVDSLTAPTRMVRNMLDRLQVRCIACGQSELQRGSFNDHIEKVCSKRIVSCPAADIKCPWTGQRDQVDHHLAVCRFEPVRSVITQFVVENQQLKDSVNKQNAQIDEQQCEIDQLRVQLNYQSIENEVFQNEETELKEQIEQLKDQVNKYQQENEKLIVELSEKEIEIIRMKNETGE